MIVKSKGTAQQENAIQEGWSRGGGRCSERYDKRLTQRSGTAAMVVGSTMKQSHPAHHFDALSAGPPRLVQLETPTTLRIVASHVVLVEYAAK